MQWRSPAAVLATICLALPAHVRSELLCSRADPLVSFAACTGSQASTFCISTCTQSVLAPEFSTEALPTRQPVCSVRRIKSARTAATRPPTSISPAPSCVSTFTSCSLFEFLPCRTRLASRTLALSSVLMAVWTSRARRTTQRRSAAR